VHFGQHFEAFFQLVNMKEGRKIEGTNEGRKEDDGVGT
jgi:hypothetical protein